MERSEGGKATAFLLLQSTFLTIPLSASLPSLLHPLRSFCIRPRCGTPGYVAPEILNAGPSESYPSQVDMFSVRRQAIGREKSFHNLTSRSLLLCTEKVGVVVYILLCAYEPFYGVNDQQLRAANKAVAYQFHSPEWDSVSPEAKDLVSLLPLLRRKTRCKLISSLSLLASILSTDQQLVDQRPCGSINASACAAAPLAAALLLIADLRSRRKRSRRALSFEK